jgi:TolB-like protein/DNA-binding winged helix-turn-helix (wHTH) protein/Tfp pilus assembly protein PilF
MPKESKDVPEPFRVGRIRVYPDRNVFTGESGEVRVEPRVMDLICALASSPSGMMSRDELIDRFWPSEFGADEGLTRAVSRLRRALREAGGGDNDIETIPKRGYRLVADVSRLSETDIGPGHSPARPARHQALILVATALAALVALGFATHKLLVPGPIGADNQEQIVLAILPFDSQSATATDSYIAAALADEIQFSLAKNNSVSVIAGGSAFRFRNQKQDLKAISEALNATHIVDGALRRIEGNVRVGVNLIEARSEQIVWSTIVEHADEDIYAIRDEVAMAILSELGRGIASACEGGAGKSHVPDHEAYETYLQGRALYREGSSANLERAIDYLESATRIDPLFVDAWATLAMAELNKVQYDFLDPLEPVPAARRAALRALELSPCSVDARLAIAIADWRERSKPVADSVAEFKGILADAPNNSTVLARMGMLYHEVGQLNDAVRMFADAYRLDPLSANTVSFYVWMLHMASQRDEAQALVAANKERWPWTQNMYEVQEFPRLLAEGQYDAARVWIREFTRREGARPTLIYQSRSLLTDFVEAAESGNESQSREVLARMRATAAENRLTYNFVFELFAVAGFHDDAMQLARERIAADDFWFRGTLFRPSLREFRSDPAVLELFEMNGLLAYWQTSDDWPDFCQDPGLPYDCRSIGGDRHTL